MKGLVFFVITLICFGCNNTSNSINDTVILYELDNDEGMPLTKVVTGYAPGEDVYLRIEQYHSGLLIHEYGAYPYGTKYRSKYLYDSLNRVTTELNYRFDDPEFGSAQIETYPAGEYKYKIEDTLVDFSVNQSMLIRKLEYTYNENDSIINEKWFTPQFNSDSTNIQWVPNQSKY